MNTVVFSEAVYMYFNGVKVSDIGQPLSISLTPIEKSAITFASRDDAARTINMLEKLGFGSFKWVYFQG